VTRLVSKIYQKSQKPLKLFSIANFIRNEKPQRGRNREFWQLNFDIFGSESTISDIEIAQISLDIILEFKPPKDSFVFYINSLNGIQPNIEVVQFVCFIDYLKIVIKRKKANLEHVFLKSSKKFFN
jgi:Histidyl-tRNA synthetase